MNAQPSILVRSSPESSPARPVLLRLALAAKRAWTACRCPTSRIDVLVLTDGRKSRSLPSAEVSADLATLRVPRAYLRERPAPERIFDDLSSALRSAGASGKAASKKEAAVPRGRRGPKALFFRSLLNSPDKELGADHMYQGVFYIASALKRAGIAFVLVDGRISLAPGEFVTDIEALDKALADHPDVNLVGLSLFDDYFEKAQRLIAHIRERSDAFVAIGAMMATQNPLETLVHMPEADLFVRGAGEEVLPRILAILGSSTPKTGISDAQLEALRRLEGLAFARPGILLLAGVEQTLRVADMDRSDLDFSLLERRHTPSGTVLCASRGCPYHCYFCTSPDKGRFEGKTPAHIARLLNAYGKRLLEIYGRWSAVPSQAFGVGFYDDDFLSDRDRAAAIFRVFQKSPFFIQFIQASVNSFFVWEQGKPTDRLDAGLLDSMPEALFLPRHGTALERPYVYIGTENYVDEELKRLGKPYGYPRVETLVRELSRRRIRQGHHFIVTNPETTPDAILENLVRIARLRRLSGGFYDVLRPPIAHVVSFYSSPHYRKMALDGLLDCVMVRKRLHIDGFDEFDYPLVDRDLPLDPDARELAGRIQEFCSGDWDEALAEVLTHLLRVSETLLLEGGDPERAARLRSLVDRYHDFRSLVSQGPGAPSGREATVLV